MSGKNKEVKTSVETVTYNTLDSLLGGVYEAVVNAQSTISKANMDIWKKQHFNADGSPKTIRMELPSGAQDIPTVILVPASNIGIKDVCFEMEMNLNINEEIDKDLGRYRPLTWDDDIKSIAIKKGWHKTGNEWLTDDSANINDGILVPNGYRFLIQKRGEIWTSSCWLPNSDFSDKNVVLYDDEPDLKKNRAFRRWLDLNDFNSSEWGIASYINTSITADSSARGEGEMAKITVTFEGKDIPEGIARLNDLWVKTLPSS